MKKISREEQMMKNGGAKVRAICWTCKAEAGDHVVWANTASGLTKSMAKKNAVKSLTCHKNGKTNGHNIGYLYL